MWSLLDKDMKKQNRGGVGHQNPKSAPCTMSQVGARLGAREGAGPKLGPLSSVGAEDAESGGKKDTRFGAHFTQIVTFPEAKGLSRLRQAWMMKSANCSAALHR